MADAGVMGMKLEDGFCSSIGVGVGVGARTAVSLCFLGWSGGLGSWDKAMNQGREAEK